MIYAIHGTDETKLAEVIEEMQILGAPTIKVVDCGDYMMALEGSHRLAAAHALGLEPKLIIFEQDDDLNIASFDWFDADNWDGEVYPAGEVAGELFSVQAVGYSF